MYTSKPNYDPNWTNTTPNIVAVNDPQIRYNGTTRIREYDEGTMITKDKFGQTVRRPNNNFNQYFFKDRRNQGDVFDHYKYSEVPYGSWLSRSRANGAEQYTSIQNDKYYRREDVYELQNTIIHPTHFDKVTPERIAGDPNQVIYSYYRGDMDLDNKNAARILSQSRRRNTARKNKRKVEQQMFVAFDDGEGWKNEYQEPLNW